MAATLAHELNQPLTAIINCAEGCLDARRGLEEGERSLVVQTSSSDGGKLSMSVRDTGRG